MRPGEASSPEERIAEAVIAAVPEWAGAAVSYRDVTTPVMSPMHRNVDSFCFAVDVDAESFFLKIAHPDVRANITVPRVFAAAALAAELGVSPKPLHCVAAHDAIVFEYLDESWRPARVDDIRRPTTMESTIAAKKRFQSQPLLGHAWSVFDGVRDLLSTALDEAIDIASTAWMIEAVQDIEAAFGAAGFDVAPCHADGIASNIMLGPNGSLRLIDFDQACDTDPLYDLGVLLNEAYAFEEEMAPGLEAFEGGVRPATLARCRLYGAADDLYWALWSSVMAATTSRRGVEFLKYAQWRFLRCRMALQDPGFERLLRTI